MMRHEQGQAPRTVYGATVWPVVSPRVAGRQADGTDPLATEMDTDPDVCLAALRRSAARVIRSWAPPSPEAVEAGRIGEVA